MDAWLAIRPYLYLPAAYLLGSIPSGYLAGRWLKKIDIRKVGSGNVGATNVLRALGTGPGLAVLAADMLKGWLAVGWLAQLLGAGRGSWLPLAGSLAVVLGHNFTCFLGFKGGKGVATSAGVLFGLARVSALFCILIFIAVVFFTRFVSVGSLAASACLPPAIWLLNEGGQGAVASYQPVFWLSVALAAFVWWKHIPNLRRLAAGTENRLSFGKAAGQAGGRP